jgi:hypothetical protein
MKPRKGSAWRKQGSLVVVAEKVVQPLPRGVPVEVGSCCIIAVDPRSHGVGSFGRRLVGHGSADRSFIASLGTRPALLPRHVPISSTVANLRLKMGVKGYPVCAKMLHMKHFGTIEPGSGLRPHPPNG